MSFAAFTSVLLEKNDFINLPTGQLRIRHPAYQNRGGFVAFYVYWCPQCQDTKTTWSAVGVVPGKIDIGYQVDPAIKNEMISRSKCIKRYPLLRAVRKDGVVTDFRGDPKPIIDMICEKAGLSCGSINRCFSNKKYSLFTYFIIRVHFIFVKPDKHQL